MVCKTFSCNLLALYSFNIFVQLVLTLTLSFNNEWNDNIIPILGSLAVIVDLAITCIFADNLRYENELFQHQIYSCNWFNQSTKFKRMLIMALQRSQKPLTVMSVDFIPCSLNTLWWIEKFIYSVYVLFK